MSATLLAGGALDVGSMALNSMAQRKMDKARSAALANQQQAQATLDTAVTAQQQAALGQYDNFAGKSADQQSQLGALYNRNLVGSSAASAPTGVLPTSSNTLVQVADAQQAAKARTFATQQGDALAALDAPGETLQGANLARGQNQQQISILDNFKRGTAGWLPQALDAANQQGAGLKTLADLFHGGGQIATSIGLQGAFAPTAAPTAVAKPASSLASALPFFASGQSGSAFSLR